MTTDQHRDTGEVERRMGLKRLLFTLVNSGKGLRFLLRKEEAFQLEALLACVDTRRHFAASFACRAPFTDRCSLHRTHC